ncbi:putative parathyroid hormone 2 receptor [Trichinella spiralis]|uniref:putative parathyroid hormone 2 receptor n=1 Tax=Trichinella spiralis TaxID=6334 RepID=UPI0001EFCC44|nr:putative parathyroid hormone 2 receptor [Trichinella spiralis]
MTKFPNQTAPSCGLSLATIVASSRLFALYQGNGPAYMSIKEKNIDHMSSRRLQPNPFSTHHLAQSQNYWASHHSEDNAAYANLEALRSFEYLLIMWTNLDQAAAWQRNLTAAFRPSNIFMAAYTCPKPPVPHKPCIYHFLPIIEP